MARFSVNKLTNGGPKIAEHMPPLGAPATVICNVLAETIAASALTRTADYAH
jgi:hypothetical protein